MDSSLLTKSPLNVKGPSTPTYPRNAITEIITNGFFTVDHKWTVVYWNKAAENILGVQKDDILGKNLWETFAATIPVDFYVFYHRAFQRDSPFQFEEYWAEMGAWFNVILYQEVNTLSVSFKSSTLPAIKEDPARQLKVLNELYRFVTEVTNDCLWEWDLKARDIFWIDGGHKRVFGYPIENALIPQSFWESRIHPDDRGRTLKRLNKILATGTRSVWEDEYRFQKANGDYVYVHDRGHIIYDEKGDREACRMIGATQDITARKSGQLLLESGIEMMDDKRILLVRKIKNVITNLTQNAVEPLPVKFSEYLSSKLEYDYTYLANLFSDIQGTTIEKYYINHKIERVKELLLYGELNLTEIAYLMHYSSVSHLSAQFKKVTGLTPTHFKNRLNN